MPVDRLFTPESEIQQKNPPLMMSHVQVPPLRRPKSHYRFYKKIRTVQPDIQVHDSLEHAMQAAFSRNEDLGTIPSRPKIVAKKQKMPKQRREKNVNVIAGPSALQSPSAMVNTTKKRLRKDDNDHENGRKGKKRSRTLLDADVSLIANEQIHQKVKPALARTRYKAETDTLLLYLGVIHSVPISVLAHNTRFLRNSQPKNPGIPPPNNATANGTSGHRYFIPPKLSVQVRESEEDIMSLGDPLTWEEDFRLPVDDDSDDEVVIVEDSRVNVRPPARKSHNPRRPPPRPLPPKIDLAAETRKKQNRNKQKDHVSAVNSPKPSPSANYVVATSSSSSTGLYAEKHHQHHRNEPHYYHEHVYNPTPSAKALGKRKATNEDLPEDSFSSQHPNLNGPPILVDQPEGLATNLDVFLHTYTRSPSPDADPTSGSAFLPYSNLQSISSSSFYPSAAGTAFAEHATRLVNNSATMSTTFYRPDLNVERSPEKFLSETVLDSLEAHSKPSPSDLWSAMDDEASGQYAFATIDPTLLGGQPMLPDPEPELEAQSQQSSVDSEPSSPASQRSLDVDPSLQDDYEPSTTTTTTMDFLRPPTKRTARSASSTSSFSASAPLRDLPRRLHSKRKMPDMVAIDDLDLPSSWSSSSSSGYESSESSSDVGSESSVVVVSSRPPVKTASSVKSKSHETSQILPAAPSRWHEWPLEADELYCHQCRNKSRVLKMRCSCGKLFCARCITNRYVFSLLSLFFFRPILLRGLDLIIYLF